MQSLIGEVLERSPSSSSSSTRNATRKFDPATGFPAAEHRSKSAFARAREEARSTTSRPTQPPAIQTINPTPPVAPAPVNESSESQWIASMSSQNEQRVENMTETEREEGRREILERFGPGILEAMRKLRQKRATDESIASPTKEDSSSLPGPVPLPGRPTFMNVSTSDSAIHTPQHSSKPASPLPSALRKSVSMSLRPSRSLRFSDEPAPVHVYESAPTSPKRRATVALLPPPDPDNPSANQLRWRAPTAAMSRGSPSSSVEDLGSPIIRKKSPPPEAELVSEDATMSDPLEDEGSPEYIRKRYFPSQSAEDPSLDWMKHETTSRPPSDETRYDLEGRNISQDLQRSLPTHLGLHHHGMHQDLAGYTIDELLILTRSTVPAQRASMLGVLAKVVTRNQSPLSLPIDKALEAALEGLSERGSVGARAVELLHAVIMLNPEGLETEVVPFLRMVVEQLRPSTQTLPYSSLLQLLAILVRLSEVPQTATQVLQTPELLQSVLQTFNAVTSEPNAVVLVRHIVRASRSNAKKVVDEGVADAFLRFVAFREPEHQQCLIETLELYTTLAQYGMYANTASTAAESITALAQEVLQACPPKLTIAFCRLLEGWTICAVDPHATTPPHDIIWSRIQAWNWAEDFALPLRSHVLSTGDQNLQFEIMPAIWSFLATWIEGSTLNAPNAGQEEKAVVVSHLGDEHHDEEVELIQRVLDDPELLPPAKTSRLLHDAVRLTSACQPQSAAASGLTGLVPESVFRRILLSCRRVMDDVSQYHQHPATSNLAVSAALLDRKCGISPLRNWLIFAAQTFRILLPGDEALGNRLLGEICDCVSRELVVDAWEWATGDEVWNRGGLRVILPFLQNALWVQVNEEEGEEREIVGPLVPTPASLQVATTLCHPRITDGSTSKRKSSSGLPLRNDWCFAALDALLHSGTASVFKALPPTWDYSEVDVVRATLLLARILQDADEDGDQRVLTREDVTFNCMKIFMLEHGQASSDTFGNDSSEEVFRDSIVSRDMDLLLAPFRIGSATPGEHKGDTLEHTAQPYLGASTPFFQFYSDFLGLYDSVSFGHRIFGALLLPPLANATYPPDYRKLLWGDYPHIVRHLTFEPQDVIGSDLRDWLYPVERDGEVLGMYLKALGAGRVGGFLRWVAVHHLAYNVWPDLQGALQAQASTSDTAPETTAGTETQLQAQAQQRQLRALKILRALLSNAPQDAVREVVLYRQQHQESLDPAGTDITLRAPPICYEESEESGWKRNRWEWALSSSSGDGAVEGDSRIEQLRALLLTPT